MKEEEQIRLIKEQNKINNTIQFDYFKVIDEVIMGSIEDAIRLKNDTKGNL